MDTTQTITQPPTILTEITLDCSQCVQDSLFETSELQEHFLSKLKVCGKTGQLGKKTEVLVEDGMVKVVSQRVFSKRYIKYLAKKFLYSRKIKDWVRVLASDRKGFRFAYYSTVKDADE